MAVVELVARRHRASLEAQAAMRAVCISGLDANNEL